MLLKFLKNIIEGTIPVKLHVADRLFKIGHYLRYLSKILTAYQQPTFKNIYFSVQLI